MTRKTAIFGALLMTIATGTGLAEGDATVGEAKAAACAACHGLSGISANPLYPNLAGQHPGYLINALKAYQSGTRGDRTMRAMAAPLSNEDIAILAKYYSQQSCEQEEFEP